MDFTPLEANGNVSIFYLGYRHPGRTVARFPHIFMALRQQAVKLSADGVSFRRIARHLGVDHVTVMLWVKAHTDQLPDAPLPAEKPLHMVEMDELYTFVGKKKTGSTS